MKPRPPRGLPLRPLLRRLLRPPLRPHRVLRLLLPLAVVVAASGCGTTGMLREVTWGEPLDEPYEIVLDRTKQVVTQQFPRGLDPDLSDEDGGDLWTVWHYETSVWYRDTKRRRGHVKVETMKDGRVRVGVSVVQQINDNIDNPHDIDEARWVARSRDIETEGQIHSRIARRYLKVEPSERWEETRRHAQRQGQGQGLRRDLVDRESDVVLPDPEKDLEAFYDE
jgi:hypothetical protein